MYIVAQWKCKSTSFPRLGPGGSAVFCSSRMMRYTCRVALFVDITLIHTLSSAIEKLVCPLYETHHLLTFQSQSTYVYRHNALLNTVQQNLFNKAVWTCCRVLAPRHDDHAERENRFILKVQVSDAMCMQSYIATGAAFRSHQQEIKEPSRQCLPQAWRRKPIPTAPPRQ